MILLTKSGALYFTNFNFIPVKQPNYFNGCPSDKLGECLTPVSFADKDTSFSCKMTNYVFKVTNHLIKIYKWLNTVWPKWRLLSWINFRGRTGFSEKSIPNTYSTLTHCTVFLWCFWTTLRISNSFFTCFKKNFNLVGKNLRVLLST